MSDLKPCPFCGGDDVDGEVRGLKLNGESILFAFCNSCEAGAPLDVWNTRHIPEGYALVPVDPTGEMIAYGAEALKWQDYDTDAESCYRAMTKAAQEHNE